MRINANCLPVAIVDKYHVIVLMRLPVAGYNIVTHVICLHICVSILGRFFRHIYGARLVTITN